MIVDGIYLNENEKEKILELYEKELQIAIDIDDTENLALLNSEHIRQSIQLLREKNILSLNLILHNSLFPPIEITLPEEIFNEITSGMDPEEASFLKRNISQNNNQIRLYQLSLLFIKSPSLNSFKIPLNMEVATNYKNFIQLFSNIHFKNSTAQVLQDLTDGFIKYEDMNNLVKMLNDHKILKNINLLELLTYDHIDLQQFR